jgi:hypothetical protein
VRACAYTDIGIIGINGISGILFQDIPRLEYPISPYFLRVPEVFIPNIPIIPFLSKRMVIE